MDDTTANVIALLFSYFIIALVFESAMSVIFNWRLFWTKYNHKGYKTIILVISSFLLTTSLKLNVFEELLSALDKNYIQSPNVSVEIILTALFIAGGSGSIFEIMEKIKYKNQIISNPTLKKDLTTISSSLLDVTSNAVSLKDTSKLSSKEKLDATNALKNIQDILNKNS